MCRGGNCVEGSTEGSGSISSQGKCLSGKLQPDECNVKVPRKLRIKDEAKNLCMNAKAESEGR